MLVQKQEVTENICILFNVSSCVLSQIGCIYKYIKVYIVTWETKSFFFYAATRKERKQKKRNITCMSICISFHSLITTTPFVYV